MVTLDNLTAAKVLSGFNILDAAANLCGYLYVNKSQNIRRDALAYVLEDADSQSSRATQQTLRQILHHTLCFVLDISLFGILYS